MITPQQMGFRGWTAVRALPYLDASAKDQMREAVKTYMAGLDKQLDATPFGVPPSLGTWGGSGAVVDMAIRMYFLHKAFPDLVSPEYTLRAVNYILGTHPVSSTSYVAGVGTVSKTKTYSNNRADNAYIPGAVIPGYIIIKPDFPECIDDFGFLWFEDEAVVAGSASWVVAGNAADAIIKESSDGLLSISRICAAGVEACSASSTLQERGDCQNTRKGIQAHTGRRLGCGLKKSWSSTQRRHQMVLMHDPPIRTSKTIQPIRS